MSAEARMQALAIAMVKNEADLVEAFVRHNLHYVDLLVVIDNASTDGTREILEALRREGLPLLVYDDPVFGHFQSEKVTHVYRKVAPVFNPELVFLLDADEFIRAPDRATLEAGLRSLAPGSVALLPWQTHMPALDVSADQAMREPLAAMSLRRRQEQPCYHKAVIRRRAEDDAQLVIEQGNHGVHLEGGRPLPASRLAGVCLSHYPVRSVAQVSAKVINGWLAIVARRRGRVTQGEAFQWKLLYDRIVGGEELDPSTLLEIAMAYAQQERSPRDPAQELVQDPTPAHHGALRYLALGRHHTLAKLALSMEAHLGAPARADAATAVPRDLAPLRDLLRVLGAHSVDTVGADPGWTADLIALHPQLQHAGPTPDLLLAPGLDHPQALALARTKAPLARQAIVYWPDHDRTPPQMTAQLQAWHEAGWTPHLMHTLGYRALASYAAQRHHCVVLHPAQPAAQARDAMVRDLICALSVQPVPWTDPPAQQIRHPLQTLALDGA
jgi:Glycosyl transferase family 2